MPSVTECAVNDKLGMVGDEGKGFLEKDGFMDDHNAVHDVKYVEGV